MDIISKINTAILSYGMSGRIFHAPFLELHDRFNLYAVLERSKNTAQSDYPQVIRYQSIEALLSDDNIELVVVNTPNDTHFEYAKAALEAGKHVLVEKPFVPTVAEAEYLYSLAKEKQKYILPYQNRRFDSDFLSLQYILEKEFVGKPIELHLRFDRYRPDIGPKTFKENKQPGSGVIFDLGAHLLDQVLSLFGRPKSVTKITSSNRKKSKVDDYGCLVMNYTSGLNVYITLSLLVADPTPSVVLHGTRGSFIKNRTDVQEIQLQNGLKPNDPSYGIEATGEDGKLTIYHDDGIFEQILVPSDKGNYMALFDAVYETIRNNKAYFVTEAQIYWQLEILSSSTVGG